jgi:hypothetical protein
MALPAAPAWSASPSNANREAIYLEQAFRHDLRTRDDRALRKLTRALSKRPTVTTR